MINKSKILERKIQKGEKAMLPKLEVHFGDSVLHIPQNKKVNLITFAYKRDTLKEDILMCYRGKI